MRESREELADRLISELIEDEKNGVMYPPSSITLRAVVEGAPIHLDSSPGVVMRAEPFTVMMVTSKGEHHWRGMRITDGVMMEVGTRYLRLTDTIEQKG